MAVFILQSGSVTAWCLQMVAASTCSCSRSSWPSGTDEGVHNVWNPFFGFRCHHRIGCSQTLEEQRRFVTIALKNVNHSTIPSTKNWEEKDRTEDNVPRTLVPADTTIHVREDRPTVQLFGDSEVAGNGSMASML